TQETLPSWIDSIWQGLARPAGLVRFGVSGFIKSLRAVPTLLLMRLAFGAGLCRFGMFRAIRANSVERRLAVETASRQAKPASAG
ncbi:MAG: SAM-dependent methyltransferase, partial [Oscillatoriales cyanobacterium]